MIPAARATGTLRRLPGPASRYRSSRRTVADSERRPAVEGRNLVMGGALSTQVGLAPICDAHRRFKHHLLCRWQRQPGRSRWMLSTVSSTAVNVVVLSASVGGRSASSRGLPSRSRFREQPRKPRMHRDLPALEFGMLGRRKLGPCVSPVRPLAASRHGPVPVAAPAPAARGARGCAR